MDLIDPQIANLGLGGAPGVGLAASSIGSARAHEPLAGLFEASFGDALAALAAPVPSPLPDPTLAPVVQPSNVDAGNLMPPSGGTLPPSVASGAIAGTPATRRPTVDLQALGQQLSDAREPTVPLLSAVETQTSLEPQHVPAPAAPVAQQAETISAASLGTAASQMVPQADAQALDRAISLLGRPTGRQGIAPASLQSANARPLDARTLPAQQGSNPGRPSTSAPRIGQSPLVATNEMPMPALEAIQAAPPGADSTPSPTHSEPADLGFVSSGGSPAAQVEPMGKPSPIGAAFALSSAAVEETHSAPRTLSVATPLNEQGWGDAFGERVVWMSSQRVQSAQLELNPPHLGAINVQVSVTEEQATVSFAAHHVLVRDAIETALPRLRELFESAGIELVDVNVSAGEEQQDNRHSERDPRGSIVAYDDSTGLTDEPDAEATAPAQPTAAARSLIDFFA